ncbi:MAG TPA: phosphatidylserine/phosphatidylglycerophosphate/cardiolipin synthase family protein [Longimicrobiaceae bacterium]|nr:phosphatidylserine/phosphatidylglycerophosphate/cardiolipin synthase family protein [Longimicrobiaceae bacterium]
MRLLLDGSESYGAMLDLVEEAREEVLFENFIFRGDAVGLAFAAALRRRAEEGVRVRVLHDPFGALMSRRAPIGFHFHGSPAWVRVYNPPRPTPAFFRDGRDHRKLVVQDRRRAVVGGLCLADAWMGNCVERCTWRDSAVLVEGAAAGEVAAEFDRMWGRGRSFTPRIAPKGVETAPLAAPATAAPPGDVPVRVLPDEPGARRTERVLVHGLDSARSEALLTTPYLLPTPPLAEAMCAAARRGVDVQVLVPLHGNHRVVALSAEHAVGELLRAGVKVWQWTGPLVHAKTAVVDSCWSLVGSSNLDPLSLVRNAELNLEVHGAAFAAQLRASFARDRGLSRPLSEDAWRERPLPRRLLTRAAALGWGWQ